MAEQDSSQLYALVDMGSNGIRFSISNLSSPTARLIPTVFQSRSGISIYDAQFSGKSGTRVSIPSDTISEIILSLKSFVRTCQAFQVPSQNIRILATEATRTAPNGAAFREQVKSETGLTIELLSKEEEGRIGALGIASSFPAPIKGIVLDLGGGSVQISWVRLDVEGELQRSESAISMPFGAAAMMERLESGSSAKDLSSEIESSFRSALQELKIPDDMVGEAGDGLTLYLSGGGFRGWGYTLMDRHHIDPYPIPIVNGFSVPAKQFNPEKVFAKSSSQPVSGDEFRISSRRASQSPVVQLLISSLLAALPKVSTVHFAQGGVREGSLFSLLPQSVQSQDPLLAATSPYASSGGTDLSNLILSAIPIHHNHNNLPSFLQESHGRESFIQSLTNLLTHHGSCPKDIRPSAALRSTTTGILAATHGLTHDARAWLALALLARWDAAREDLPKTDLEFYDGLTQLIGAVEAWWAGYVGRLAAVIGALYPAGVLPAGQTQQWKWEAKWEDMGKKKKERIAIRIDTLVDDDNVAKAVKQVGKWGKKKNWESRLVEGWKIDIEGLQDDSDD